MITVANLGENLMRQYPKKRKRNLLRDKAIDRGTLGSTDKAWYDHKKKEYRLPKNQIGGK
jgi:hypothetical protein